MVRAKAAVDPRIERTRETVSAAVAALMAEGGPAAVTHQRVGHATGLSRTTLYRHWPSAGDLLYEALEGVDRVIFKRPGAGSLPGWLRESLRRAAVELAEPSTVQLTASLIARAPIDDDSALLRRRLIDRNVEGLTEAMNVAFEQHMICALPDVRTLFTVLVGPVFQRVVFEGGHVSDAFIETVVATATPMLHKGPPAGCQCEEAPRPAPPSRPK